MIVGNRDITNAVPRELAISAASVPLTIGVAPLGVAKMSARLDGQGSGDGDVVLTVKVYDVHGRLLKTSDEVTVRDGDEVSWVEFPFTKTFELDDGVGAYLCRLMLVSGSSRSVRVWVIPAGS